MILSRKNSLLEDIAAARKAGYMDDFMYRAQQLISRTSKKAYSADACTLVEYCRHEGMNDPGDSSILFLIACNDGTKGCLTSAYGVDADTNLIEFVRSLPRAQN